MTNRFLLFANAAVIFGAALSTQALAEPPSASEVIAKLKAKDPVDSLFVVGIVDGLGSANAYLEGSGKRPLYCQPENLAVTSQQAGDILERYVKKIPGTEYQSVDTTLLHALIDAFPCKAKP